MGAPGSGRDVRLDMLRGMALVIIFITHIPGLVFAGLTPQIHPEIGFNLLLALFAAAIFGGAGSLPGAVIGGLLVGIAENLFLLVVPPGYKPAMPFVLLLLVLLFRPDGLFGEKR